MSENYKITKTIAYRIVELRNDGNSFPKISNQIKNEFGVDVFRSSIERFYKNFLLGKSRILPKNEMNIEINQNSFRSKPKVSSVVNTESNANKTAIDKDFTDSTIYQGLSGSDLNKGKQPSDELLGFFKKKPLVK